MAEVIFKLFQMLLNVQVGHLCSLVQQLGLKVLVKLQPIVKDLLACVFVAHELVYFLSPIVVNCMASVSYGCKHVLLRFEVASQWYFPNKHANSNNAF